VHPAFRPIARKRSGKSSAVLLISVDGLIECNERMKNAASRIVDARCLILAGAALVCAIAVEQTFAQGIALRLVDQPAPPVRIEAPVPEFSKIFTYFMVMLGPFKLLGPFTRMTSGMDERSGRKLAFKAFGIACLGGCVAAVVGQALLWKWGVSVPALVLATGVVLLLVALQTVLSQYSTVADRPAAVPPANAFQLAFPNIITPYGTAGLVLLLAASPDLSRDAAILGVFVAVMLLDLLAMWFARPILKYAGSILVVVGAVLGVLQVALAIQMLLLAGRLLGVLPSVTSG
jgi:multiple antibiotic resistance protein